MGATAGGGIQGEEGITKDLARSSIGNSSSCGMERPRAVVAYSSTTRDGARRAVVPIVKVKRHFPC